MGTCPALWLFSQPAQADAGGHASTAFWVLAGLSVLQGVMILLLQKSRVKYKRAQNSLEQAKASLQARIEERTDSLRTSNNQLTDALARHEIAEELLRETQDYLHSIINSMPSVLIGVSRQGHITLWNAAAERLIGISSNKALGQPIDDIYPEIAITTDTIEMAIDSQVPQTLENIQQGTGSNCRYSDITVYPLMAEELGGAVIRIDDVTLRVRVETMMIQNEKMLSLGELAAGMAHEINNPLAAILNNVQNISRRLDPNLPMNQEQAAAHGISLDEARRYWELREIPKFLQHIREAGERSARIVSNMLEFSRNQYRDHAPTHIPELLDNSLELAIHSMQLDTGEDTELPNIVKLYAQDLPPITCSAVEIQQVILNLLRNAFQAFQQQEYGPPLNPTITLNAFEENDWFCIEVTDNGPGIQESVRRHIFEPFFTTKEVGEGTGLGLSVSYFIITEHHGGTIGVESTPGLGSSFKIRLPGTPSH
ncbi:ATP-binding protein [Simiduia sp. 21SJ11W-1]|uniref:two-component system sensor histidine kinase NtrB n=1 Tax=Simiduia sp. 21SJ11W-1 TaxID=2909669 RepID=UPI0020A029E3|nr:ATP-binding protein [Simiduia sp. 21SJ11W-1]UTA49340.1 ATP-binding protein [Simiduia sp. 21SJ11W-1]